MKMKTLVALVRVPERVAEGLKCRPNPAEWCGRWLGAAWEGAFELDEWEDTVRERFGCVPDDRERFAGLDAGFIDAGGDAERALRGFLAVSGGSAG